MKKFIKKTAKGFTRIELIIVMAIFGVLMVGAMALINPVSKIFKSASVSEKTYSYMNTIQNYLEDSLKYSENLWLYTANNVDLDGSGTVEESEILDLAEQYRERYYDNVVMNNSTDAATAAFAEGKVRVLCLQNTNSGRISLREYDFTSNSNISTAASPVEQLNEAYFSANDSRYSFRYALGANSFVNVDAVDPATSDPIDSSSVFSALSYDYNNVNLADSTLSSAITVDNLSVSIVAVRDNEIYDQVKGDGTQFVAFKQPCGLIVANLPLMNIISRSNNSVARPYWKEDPTNPGTYLRDGNSKPELALQSSNNSFVCSILDTSGSTAGIDLDQDIYFIYSYRDELKLP